MEKNPTVSFWNAYLASAHIFALYYFKYSAISSNKQISNGNLQIEIKKYNIFKSYSNF